MRGEDKRGRDERVQECVEVHELPLRDQVGFLEVQRAGGPDVP